MNRIAAVEPRSDYRLWVRFEDGTEGEVDLSDIAGSGVFRRWTDHLEAFRQVQIHSDSGAPTWPGDLDVVPDRIYEELTAGSQVEPRRAG